MLFLCKLLLKRVNIPESGWMSSLLLSFLVVPEGNYGVMGKTEHCRNCHFSLPQNVLVQSRSAGFSHDTKRLFYSLPLAKWYCDTEVSVTWVQRSWGSGEDTGGKEESTVCSDRSQIWRWQWEMKRTSVAHSDDTSKKARKSSSCHKKPTRQTTKTTNAP